MSEESRRTLLLVEDQALIALVEKKNLEKYGYSVLVVDTGERAVEAVRSQAGIDLILMDINLGEGMDGTEAAMLILKSRDIPIVFLSSHLEPEIVEKTETITSYGYVVKNSGITVLDASIKMAFKLHEANRRLNESEVRQRAMLSDLAMERDLFQELLDASPDLIHFKDLDGRFIRASRAQARYLGLRDPSLLIGKTDFDFIDEKEAAQSQAEDREVTRTGSAFSGEMRRLLKDGSPVWLSTVKLPTKGAGGRISGSFAVTRDISEKKAFEEALRASEAKYRSYVENAPDGVFVVDEGGRFLDVNRAACAMTGFTRPELIELPFERIVNNKSPELTRSMFSRIFETGSARLEVMYRQREGGLRWASIEAVVLPGRLVLAFAKDTTDRRRAESRVHEFRTRLDLTMRAAKILWWELDVVTGGISFEAKNVFGYSPESMRTFGDFAALIHPDDLAALRRSREGLLSGRSVTYEAEIRARAKGGDFAWYYVLAARPKARRGHVPKQLSGILMDIDARKRHETEIQDLLQEKELILKEVHHRIKNNMGTIKSLLGLQSSMLSDPEAISAFDDTENRIASMMLLYERLFESSYYRNTSMTGYLSTLVDQIVGTFPNHESIRVEKRIEEFDLDIKRLQTLGIIINEIITNIMKYAFVGREGGAILVTGRLAGGHVTLSIQDDGNGMPEGISFEHSPGFGLMLVNEMTKQIQGRIWIERGAGTKVVLEFETEARSAMEKGAAT